MQYTYSNFLNERQKAQVRNLWNQEYPISIYHTTINSFERYLSTLEQQKHILLKNDSGLLLAWYVDFIRDDEVNFAIIVSAKAQGKGYGRLLIEKAKEYHTELNAWIVKDTNYLKIDESVYTSPISFYEKLGFQILFDITLETETLKTVKIRWKKEN